MKVLSLQNISHDRGTDRIIEVAELLPNCEFLVAGEVRDGMDVHYRENVIPIGYVNPEDALEGCDVLIRLTRRGDPWGRDIIEALTMGVPVVATGTDQEFIRNGVNGFLVWPYHPVKVAKAIQDSWQLERVKDQRFGEYNIKRIERIYEYLVSYAKGDEWWDQAEPSGHKKAPEV